jgi:chaperonin GroEL
MPKLIDLNQPARDKLLAGARLLAKTVAVTYGPKGRTAMLDRMAGLIATKDGVTVAREVQLEDPVENMGAEIIRAACVKVNDEMGDGTTTAAIIAAELLGESHKLITAGHDPVQLGRDIQAAAVRAVEAVQCMMVRVENQTELERVAYVACNGDQEVAKALAEACIAVGQDGTISIEDGHGVDIELVFKDGMEVDKGVASAAFLRDTGGIERVLDNPLVVVVGGPLTAIEDVQEIMEVASQWPDHPLVLIAEHITGAALTTLILNDSQGVMGCVGVNAPGFGDRKLDMLRDIAALAGATYIDPMVTTFRKDFDPELFGTFRKATLRTDKALYEAVDEAREVIADRIEELKQEGLYCDSDYDRDRLVERIAKLAGGLCVMRVGGPTEPELKERRGRVEDALGAVRGALEQGVVPGAGVAYLEAAAHVHEFDGGPGWDTLAKALLAPILRLADNAGKDGPAILYQIQKVREDDEYGWVGWDAVQDEVRDLGADPPIIDPMPVAVSVIEAAVSVTSTLLTVEGSITEKR